MDRTSSYEEAMEWALELYGELNVPRVWIPQRAFVEAIRTGDSLSFTRTTSEGLFGLAIGPVPHIPSEWIRFALPQDLDSYLTSAFTPQHHWQTHAFATREVSYEIEPLEDDEFILAFLESHAPDSSAKPGNPEIQFWGAVRNPEGEIAAIAAITQWESGEYMLSSVATHTDMRGLGYAQKVCAGILGLAYDRGIERIYLVVISSNVPAIRAYKKVGFQEIGKFVTYSR